MGKPADRLRGGEYIDAPQYKVDDLADLLDEAERVIQQYAYDMEFGVSGDSVARRAALANFTLAKLRGEQ